MGRRVGRRRFEGWATSTQQGELERQHDFVGTSLYRYRVVAAIPAEAVVADLLRLCYHPPHPPLAFSSLALPFNRPNKSPKLSGGLTVMEKVNVAAAPVLSCAV